VAYRLGCWTCGFNPQPFCFQVTTLGKLFTHVPLSPSSIIWYRSSGGDALQLHRSGIALAVRHRLHWFIHLQAHGLRREMSTPPTLLMGYGTLYLNFSPYHWIYNSLKSFKMTVTSNHLVKTKKVSQTAAYSLAILQFNFPLSTENLMTHSSSYAIAWHYHLHQTHD